MVYDKIDEAYLPALDSIFSQINRNDATSINDIKKTASLLMAFEPYLKVTSAYLNKHVKQAKANLTTKTILESIIRGEDITPLMKPELDLDSFIEGESYRWETNEPKHREELDHLRKLGFAIHIIGKPSIFIQNYEKMKSIAKELLNTDGPKFDYWQSIVDLGADGAVKPASVLDLAQFVYNETASMIEHGLSRRFPEVVKYWVEQGLGALMYLALRNEEEKKIPELIKNLIEEYLPKIPKTREYKNVRKDLSNFGKTIDSKSRK